MTNYLAIEGELRNGLRPAGLTDDEFHRLQQIPPDTSEVIGACVACEGGEITTFYTHYINPNGSKPEWKIYVDDTVCTGCGLKYNFKYVKKQGGG